MSVKFYQLTPLDATAAACDSLAGPQTRNAALYSSETRKAWPTLCDYPILPLVIGQSLDDIDFYFDSRFDLFHFFLFVSTFLQ